MENNKIVKNDKILYPENVEINENQIKLLQSTSILEKPLDPQKNYLIQTEIEIDGVGLKDNKNGTIDVIYKARGKGLVAIKGEKSKPIIAVKKDKMTPGQLTRFSLEQYHSSHYGEPGYEFICEDAEEFYKQTMQKFRWGLEKIVRLLFNINK